MKQPKKKPAVPGCSNWISLELRLSGYPDDPRMVVWAAEVVKIPGVKNYKS